MCLAFSRGNAFQAVNIDDVYSTIRRIKFAFDQGADPKPLNSVPDHMRQHQPFPACVREYLRYRHIPHAAGAILSILNDYLEKGADPNYQQPITLAAENLDPELFGLLAIHGAKFGRVFKVNSYMPASCSRGGGLTSITKGNTRDLDTLLGRLPHPKDVETPRARDFLVAFIEAGGDITEKQQRFGGDGVRCEHTMITLKERAVHAGQVTYAKMVQELEAMPRADALQQTNLKSANFAPSVEPAPTGSRITTGGINVREQPSLNGALMGTLGAGSVFDIEEAGPDGEWSLVNAPPILRGWANNTVIIKSSTPNGAVSSAPTITTSLSTPKLTGETLEQKILFLVTGIEAAPYKEIEQFHNAHGNHIKTVTHTYEPTFDGPCKLTLRYTSATKEYGAPSGLGNYSVVRTFDFSKLDRINARYTEQPEEGIWWHFAGGPSNPRLRKPRFITLVEYYGDGFECAKYENNPTPSCTTADKPRVNYAFANASKRPMHFEDTVKAVKSSCTLLASGTP